MLKRYQPDLLKKILTSIHDRGLDNVFIMACSKGKTENVKAILDAIKNRPDIWGEILTKSFGKGKISPFYGAVNLGHEKIVKLILEAVKDNPKLLKEILTQTHLRDKRSAFYWSTVNSNDITRIILEAAQKYNPDIIPSLALGKSEGKANLSVINNLLISGDWKSLEIILKYIPQLEREKLPISYYLSVSHTAIYYLEIFLKNNDLSLSHSYKNYQASYFEEQHGKLSKILVDEITLSEDKLIIIELEDKSDGKIRRVISAPDILSTTAEEGALQLKKSMEFAKKHAVNEIIFNLGFNRHGISFKVFQDSNKQWQAVYYDPNRKVTAEDSEEDINISKIYYSHIKKLLDKAGIVKSKRSEVIIPNYASSSTIADGNCDMISSIMAASVIIGPDHVNDLKNKCDQIGDKCVEVLGKKLNPQMDKILDRRLVICQHFPRH